MSEQGIGSERQAAKTQIQSGRKAKRKAKPMLAKRIVTLVCNELEARGVEIKEVGVGCKSEEEIAILVQQVLETSEAERSLMRRPMIKTEDSGWVVNEYEEEEKTDKVNCIHWSDKRGECALKIARCIGCDNFEEKELKVSDVFDI